MSVTRMNGKVEAEGRVLKIFRVGFHETWTDVYALVWNEAESRPEEVYLCTEPCGDCEASAEIDSVGAIRKEFEEWVKSAPKELLERYEVRR